MNLLVITQKVNKDDPVLGFFHRWILELSRNFEKVSVVCLEKGAVNLPPSITIDSLGKEERHSRLLYLCRFFSLIWKRKKEYDAVFVHMNQEYVLLGGWLWKLMGKKIYLWRNHQAGNWLTNLAAFFSDKVFCTSKYSYTARFKKTVLMPVGIDTDFFAAKPEIVRVPRSILFLGRIAPVKRPDLLVEALVQLEKAGSSFSASIVGDALPADLDYLNSLKEKAENFGLSSKLVFSKGIANDRAVDVYNAFEICVNLSPSGMYDKTMFEAMACQCLLLASNENLRGLIDDRFLFEEGNREDLAAKLLALLNSSPEEKREWGRTLREVVVRGHGLRQLGRRLAEEMKA